MSREPWRIRDEGLNRPMALTVAMKRRRRTFNSAGVCFSETNPLDCPEVFLTDPLWAIEIIPVAIAIRVAIYRCIPV